MNEIQNMTNSQLKAYIKVNRNQEDICHEAIKTLMSRKNQKNPQYSCDISSEEMETIFKQKLTNS